MLTKRDRMVLEDLAGRVGLRQEPPELFARHVVWVDAQNSAVRVVVKVRRSQKGTSLALRAGGILTAQQAMASTAPILAPIAEIIPASIVASRALSADALVVPIASFVQYVRVCVAKWERLTIEWAAVQVAQSDALRQVRDAGLTGFTVLPNPPNEPAIAFMANTPVVGRAAAHGDLVHLSLDNLSATDAAAILRAAAVILHAKPY